MFIPKQDDKLSDDTALRTSSQTGPSADYQVRVDRLLLADYAPPGVLINETSTSCSSVERPDLSSRNRPGNRRSIYLD